MKNFEIPRFIDLECNRKAMAVLFPKGNALLVSYNTPIAYAVWEGNNPKRTVYRLVGSDSKAMSQTTYRHWRKFAEFINRHDIAGKRNFAVLPYATTSLH